MTDFNYSNTAYEIRSDIPEAHRQVWQTIANPGNWWRGEDRVAIAAETRHARNCQLCARRKAALSPFSVDGEHASITNLPAVVIDAVHRLATDAPRLTSSWLKGSYNEGMTDGKYIELLGIVVAVISIDGFHRAMGLSPEPLPEPVSGEPSGYRPAGATDMGAWVPMVPPHAVSEEEADLYGGRKQTANVIAAMSLVPDSVRMLKILSGAHYMTDQEVANPAASGNRAITRPQIELVAGRVSALNDCFY